MFRLGIKRVGERLGCFGRWRKGFQLLAKLIQWDGRDREYGGCVDEG